VVFVAFYWFRREPFSQPSIIAAIPLSLSSISILLGQSAFLLLHTFNEIASGRAVGIRAVISGMLRAQRPLVWGFLDSAACLAVIFLIAGFLQYSRDTDEPVIHAYIVASVLVATIVVLAALFAIVYLQYGTVDLVMMVVDNHRNQELVLHYGTASPGYFAAKISSRLVSIFFLSVAESCALIAAGAIGLIWRQKQNSRQTLATVFTLGVLVVCGVSALSEFGFVDYLSHVR
jgi:hypothetical protein